MRFFVLLAWGCGATSATPEPPPAPSVVIMDVFAPPLPPAPPPVVAMPGFAAEVRSLRTRATTVVRAAPATSAPVIGRIEQGTRVAVLDVSASASGCTGRWLALVRGWACEETLEPSHDAPTALTDVEPRTGVFARVRRGTSAYASTEAIRARAGAPITAATMIRIAGGLALDDVRYVRSSKGELYPAADVAVLAPPTRFAGEVISDPAQMPAWVVPRQGARNTSVVTHVGPAATSAVAGLLAARTPVRVIAIEGDYARLDDDTWIARADLRIASIAAPPPDVGTGERWIDVDRDAQVLVAYEGETPVFATLVSTGRAGHQTPTELARIATKHVRTTMTSDRGEAYSVADVPWTMFYDGDFALHGAYWHDGFGGTRSHGCVNLAPADARWLYAWSWPSVPPGWTYVRADRDAPGSRIRIRAHDADVRCKLPEGECHDHDAPGREAQTAGT